MPRRDPIAPALRAPQFRVRRTKTKAEMIRQLEWKHRGRPLPQAG
jgi:hypothetical protein